MLDSKLSCLFLRYYTDSKLNTYFKKSELQKRLERNTISKAFTDRKNSMGTAAID